MKLRNTLSRWYRERFLEPLNELKILQSKLLIEKTRSKGKLLNIQDAEFKVFSQFGDDGIIQYIVGRLNLPAGLKTFIEFGVSDYTESNTRFLLVNNNWKGFVMDCSKENVDNIKHDKIYWMHDLTAKCEFVTKANINKIFTREGYFGDVGLLSLDIDGNDYWIWESIEVVRPIIVILEYNGVFGADRAVTIPYKKDFSRNKAHYSNLYWGASLGALYNLSKKRGYTFLGANSAGNNSYFIRDDYAKYFHKVSLKDGYVESKYRESRDVSGNLSYLSGGDRLKLIRNLHVVDVLKNRKIKLSELI